MSRTLFDTSALLKRYLPERGREDLFVLIRQARRVVVAPHCKIEIYSGLNRVRREVAGNDDAYRQTCAEVERNFAEFEVVPMSVLLERVAIRTLEHSPIRAMGALHLGAALAAGVALFVTADRRQHEGALAAGLNAMLLD